MYDTIKVNCGFHSMNIFFQNELWVMNFKIHFFLIFIFFLQFSLSGWGKSWLPFCRQMSTPRIPAFSCGMLNTAELSFFLCYSLSVTLLYILYSTYTLMNVVHIDLLRIQCTLYSGHILKSSLIAHMLHCTK